MSVFDLDDIKKSADSASLEEFAKTHICGTNKAIATTTALLRDETFGYDYYRVYNYYIYISKTEPLDIYGENIDVIEDSLNIAILKVYTADTKINNNTITFIQPHCASRAKIIIIDFDGDNIDYIDLKLRTMYELFDAEADDIICVNCPNLKTYKGEIIKYNFKGKIYEHI